MTGLDVTIELPQSDAPGELVKGYFTLMRAFGWDLYVTSHFALKSDLGPHWFAARISELKQSDPKNWRPTHRFDPQDPSVILRDYIHESDSPYLGVFGGQIQKQAAARKILGTRNTWFHFGDDPTLAQLAEAAKIVKAFVASNGMHIGDRIDRLSGRLDDLRTGRYPAEPERSEAEPPTSAPVNEPELIETPGDLPRPPIGGTWTGPIPELRYRVTKTGDIIHPDTMKSVSSEVTGHPAEKFRAWTAIEPRGRELWIDADGAVGGFIGATPRLLGYVGPDPEGEVARGFFTSHFYVAQAGEVIDLDSGEHMASPFATSAESGTTLRMTTYGDLVSVDQSDGIERVATVTPAEWFEGHLN
ncbi:hypothetical protein BKA04_001524 [Cryobacterium mesophilum]|uniref:Uncharacterized protein n=1 Tax=Terrimesophilobacter mesophilus TaxID=433647 RepID=A0A4R8VD25_9MICO|nr:hypothetical protein [Terrimesophilobacter mesophilus]MBB5633301.1 hypothetical protein [Terrimesophilobacter mesophilus]TFB80040.1 hypothetical protein E3N84_08275 [Terrimesophilobacter mesophilus]